MLVLSRKLNEAIMVRDDFRVEVFAISNDDAYVGILSRQNSQQPFASADAVDGAWMWVKRLRLEEEFVLIPGNIAASVEDTTIKLLNVRGGRVRLGIDAPKDIQVHRSEVYAAIERNSTVLQKQEPMSS